MIHIHVYLWRLNLWNTDSTYTRPYMEAVLVEYRTEEAHIHVDRWRLHLRNIEKEVIVYVRVYKWTLHLWNIDKEEVHMLAHVWKLHLCGPAGRVTFVTLFFAAAAPNTCKVGRELSLPSQLPQQTCLERLSVFSARDMGVRGDHPRQTWPSWLLCAARRRDESGCSSTSVGTKEAPSGRDFSAFHKLSCTSVCCSGVAVTTTLLSRRSLV